MSSFILFHGDGIFKYLIKFTFTGKDQGFRLRVERADQSTLKLSDSLTELWEKGQVRHVSLLTLVSGGVENILFKASGHLHTCSEVICVTSTRQFFRG